MNEEIQAKAFELIEQLAAKLGVASEHMWEIILKQQDVWIGLHTMGAAIFGGLTLGAIILLIYGIKKDSELRAAGGFFGVFFSLFTIANGIEAWLIKANPEFYALKELLEMVNP